MLKQFEKLCGVENFEISKEMLIKSQKINGNYSEELFKSLLKTFSDD
jgi:hypothetical protein